MAEKQYLEIKDYIHLTQWKIKLNQRQEELDKQKAWLELHALDLGCIEDDLTTLKDEIADQKKTNGIFTMMFGHSGIDIKTTKQVVNNFVLTSIEIDTDDVIEDKPKLFMDFLRLENYMQVDF